MQLLERTWSGKKKKTGASWWDALFRQCWCIRFISGYWLEDLGGFTMGKYFTWNRGVLRNGAKYVCTFASSDLRQYTHRIIFSKISGFVVFKI
jgi:hypothetical protein